MVDFTRLFLSINRRKRGRLPPPLSIPQDLTANTIGHTSVGDTVSWPRPSKRLASHACIWGASGSGKTILTANALVQELRLATAHESGLLVLDPKGDLVDAVLRGLYCQRRQACRQVVWLNPFVGGFAFNLANLQAGRTPLDIRAVQLANLVGDVSGTTAGQSIASTGARQQDVLAHLLLATLDSDHPAASPLWAYDALTTNDGQKLLAAVTKSDRAKQFLSGTKLSAELKTSCAARLRSAFAASFQLERLFAANTCIDFAELLAPGNIVLVDLGSPPGGMLPLTRFYANLLLRLAVDHLMERPSPFKGHHVRIVIDEAHLVAPVLVDVAERILTTGRSRGISLVTLTQGTTQIAQASPTLLRTMLTNTNLRISGRLAAADAALLAREQAPLPGANESIAAMRARLTTRLCNLPDRHFYHFTAGGRRRFRSVDVNMVGWDGEYQTNAEEVKALKARFALPAGTGKRMTLAEAAAGARPPGDRPKLSPRSKRQRRTPNEPRSPWG